MPGWMKLAAFLAVLLAVVLIGFEPMALNRMAVRQTAGDDLARCAEAVATSAAVLEERAAGGDPPAADLVLSFNAVNRSGGACRVRFSYLRTATAVGARRITRHAELPGNGETVLVSDVIGRFTAGDAETGVVPAISEFRAEGIGPRHGGPYTW